MFHLFDLHIHSAFSDGQIDTDTMIQMYIDSEYKIIGLADHVFPGAMYSHPRDSNMNPKGLGNNFNAENLRYRKKVIRFYDKKYPQIRILNAGEVDTAMPNGALTLPRGINSDFFDYLMIVKHHTIPKEFSFLYKKFPNMEKWMWKHNPRLRINAFVYEQGLYAAFNKYKVDILAHPQELMPKAIGHYMDRKRMKRFVLMCKKHGVALELNHLIKDRFTPRDSIKWFYPILEMGHEYGVKFSLGSDFHGFKKNSLKELINHGQTMMSLVEKYDLELIDPHKFLPENTGK